MQSLVSNMVCIIDKTVDNKWGIYIKVSLIYLTLQGLLSNSVLRKYITTILKVYLMYNCVRYVTIKKDS